MSVDEFLSCHVVHAGYTVLVTPDDGDFGGSGASRAGLYDYDTRILSQHCLRLDGARPICIGAETIGGDQWDARLMVPRSNGGDGQAGLPQDVLDVHIRRRVGMGMLERIDVTNRSMAGAEAMLTLTLAADFRDVMDAQGRWACLGQCDVQWHAPDQTLVILFTATHRGRQLTRGLRVRVVGGDTRSHFHDQAIQLPLTLAPRQTWHVTLSFASLVDGHWRDPLGDSGRELTRRAALRHRWRNSRLEVISHAPRVGRIVARAASDLGALRQWELEAAPDAWVPNAGVPTYTGLFGRDVLTSAWQAALLGPEMMRGALELLARAQATADSPWRDAEPGKLPHEMRRGPLSELDILPQRAYYGEQTAQAMFAVVLTEYWHWTGDTAALARWRDVALRTFEWAERNGDCDGDGFLEYTRRSSKGLKNHGWKDSDEAIRYPDGRIVENPIATIEEQAYHYLARQRMGEALVALQENERADRFLEQARSLRERVEQAFWMPQDNYYALALDPLKQPVASISSNPGHALATGLPSAAHARAVADRLLDEDLFSGWGVRTLSARHPSYNPFAYHLGSVWPVENATFVLGCKRYGLDTHVARLSNAMFDAAARFERYRLPEALTGHARGDARIPLAYPESNAPQAWSASAILLTLQAMLGLYPFAPLRLLGIVRPQLPAGVDVLTIHRLRVGDATLSLRFTRGADATVDYTVLERHGTVRVIEVAPPVDAAGERETVLDHVKRWGLRHAGGRSARALRIALGLMD